MRPSIQLLVVTAAFGTAGVVRAQDQALVQEWPRFHIGVAVGSPHWSVDISEAGVPFPDPILEENADAEIGYKLVAGFRPLRVVAVELQFVDFGEEDTSANGGFQYGGQIRGIWQQETEMVVSTQALVLSAVLFIPDTSPQFDVYAKVGVAELDESISARAIRRSEIECPPPGVRIGTSGAGPCEFTSDVHERGSGPYVGIGARFKVAREAALRVEYEAIDSAFGDATTMFSVGIAWEH